MSLRFHNQLSKQVDEFKPLNDGTVSLYTCGPTVYNYLTIGNWAAYVYWDTLVRVLQAHGYKVTRVMNITDVGHLVSDADEGEDKLEKGAKREGKNAWEIAQFYTDDFLKGMQLLNLIQPTYLPRATDYIDQQLELVRTLKQKGHTYQIDDGIYFDTSTFKCYGEFAQLDVKAQQAGARVEFNPQKRHPSDFALWKFTPEHERRDMQWITPADITSDNNERPGFPGWHLECSAMAMAILGETIDIHTGGIDHIPVHHTNEIAQSEAASGKRFANYWLHNNHMKVNGTKISKSLGNGYTLDDIIQHGYDPLDLRLFILQSQYRNEGNFTFENLSAAKNRRLHWRNIAALRHQTHDTIQDTTTTEETTDSVSLYAASRKLLERMSDDLNTAEALAFIDMTFDTIASSSKQLLHRHAFQTLLETIDDLLGINLLQTTPDINEENKRLVLARDRARENKDFKTSDRLRHELRQNGIIIRDTPSGSVWEYDS